ncbi:MAG: hypothetical protein ACTSV7_00585 [Candidatus Baldrarchaeia archaeon]
MVFKKKMKLIMRELEQEIADLIKTKSELTAKLVELKHRLEAKLYKTTTRRINWHKVVEGGGLGILVTIPNNYGDHILVGVARKGPRIYPVIQKIDSDFLPNVSITDDIIKIADESLINAEWLEPVRK